MQTTDHDLLLKRLVRDLQLLGAKSIRADIEGFQKPTKIVWTRTQEGHIPDASATVNGSKTIFEVETCDTLFSDHTESQLKLFGAYSKQQGVSCFIVVPAACHILACLQVWKLKVAIQVVSY